MQDRRGGGGPMMRGGGGLAIGGGGLGIFLMVAKMLLGVNPFEGGGAGAN